MSYDNIMVLCSLLFLTAYNNYFSVCTYVCVLVLMLLVSICWSLDVVDGRCPDTGHVYVFMAGASSQASMARSTT